MSGNRSALDGKVVLVTRSEEQAAELSRRLRERGAVPLHAPTIRLQAVPPRGRLDEAVRLAATWGPAWVVFTSAMGVSSWFDRAAALGVGPPRGKVAAVGEGTAAALRGRGVAPELVPDEFTTEALGRAFPPGSGEAVLARADIASNELDDALRAKGWEVTRVDAYRNLPAEVFPEEARRALEARTVDAITFASASAVNGFVRLVGRIDGPRVACIGPVTADAAREAGLPVHRVAEPHTIEGLVTALEELYR